MRTMDTRINVAWIFLTILNATRLNSAQSNRAHCGHYELMSCGSINKSWDFCEPRTAHVIRILSAHLDIRYDTRNCRKYGTPHNFGLTFTGRALWTVNACFGSFFLCLEIGSSSNNTTKEDDNHSSEINDIKGDYFQSHEYTISESDDNTDVIDDLEKSTKTAVADYVNVMYDNDTVTLSMIHNDTDVSKTAEKNEFIQHEESNNSIMKYWIMGCMISGGVIIVLLIAVMAYLCSCTDSQDDAGPQERTQTSRTSTKYFRQKKWSIAPLMSECSRTESVTSSTMPSSMISITDDYKDVYDFIPADTTSNNNSNTKVKSESDVKPTLHIVDETENTEQKHDYFVLVPETLPGDDKMAKADTDTENEYDHLIHVPKQTVVDSSTYNHIDIKTGTTDGDDVHQG